MTLPIIKNPRDIQMQEELAAAVKNNKATKTPAKVSQKDTLATTISQQSFQTPQ